MAYRHDSCISSISIFMMFYSRTGSFFDVNVKMPVAILKNDGSDPNFLLKRCTCLSTKGSECWSVSLSYDICSTFQN